MTTPVDVGSWRERGIEVERDLARSRLSSGIFAKNIAEITLGPAVHILGSQNVYSRAEGFADHYWSWAVFLF